METIKKQQIANALRIYCERYESQNKAANSVKYDAFVKIYVEGYKAFAQSRYGGGREYVIWKQGAEQYWGQTL